jgi:GT2 family glycosyltransferase
VRSRQKARDMVRPSDVAVVVPTRNSGATLRACLESIRWQTHPSEIIVVDNNSSDSTLAIGRELADQVMTVGPERSAQRNAGAACTTASIVGFIDSDMILSPSVVAEVVKAVELGAASVVIPEKTVGRGYWAAVSAYERSFYVGDDRVEAPRFFPSHVFSSVGGFDEAMTGAEDWDLGLRTAVLGPRVRIDAEILHDEGQVRYFNICLKKAYYAPGVALFIRKHGISTLRDMSRRTWIRKPRVLLNPLGMGLVLLKAGQAAAMTIAFSARLIGRSSSLPDRPNPVEGHQQDGP